MEYITKFGEPAINTSWALKLRDMPDTDHLTLITKNPGAFIKSKLEYAIEQNKSKVTIYCCITGYGKSPMEPEVPMAEASILATKYLIDKGYDVVLLINPIIPTVGGFQKAMHVIDLARKTFGSLEGIKIQFDFITYIDNHEERGLEYAWLNGEEWWLPSKDDTEKGIVSVDTINEYFMAIEFQDKAIISSPENNVLAWTVELVEYTEILDGDDVMTQCEYGCRYCYLLDRYNNAPE